MKMKVTYEKLGNGTGKYLVKAEKTLGFVRQTKAGFKFYQNKRVKGGLGNAVFRTMKELKAALDTGEEDQAVAA